MRLTVFMTRGLSLRKWQESGMFAREVALYKRLRNNGVEVGIVTYGAEAELDFADELKGIHILHNQWNLPGWLYAFLLPYLHKSWLKRTDLIKSNQTNGAEVALRAAKMFGKPFIARCGYMWSLNVSRAHGERSLRSSYARNIERHVFPAADHIVVTTNAMVENLLSRFPQVRHKVSCIPNYVEIERFTTNASAIPDIDLLFVGRLTPEKNLENLLCAVYPTNFSLAVVGSGWLGRKLERQYGTMDGRLHWLGTIPNAELPGLLQRTKLFVQPSYYEGHPKTVLEALSSGLPVVGTNVSGMRELIRHGENGWLCDTSADSIRSAIMKLMGDEKLRHQLGKGGRQCVLENYGLDLIVERECKLYREVISSSA